MIKIIYTKAIPDWDRSSIYGGRIWRCPRCNYFPGVSELPDRKCLNCKEWLEVSGVDKGITTITTIWSNYGLESVKIN